MLLVLDESGDRGLEVAAGQSPWFLIAALLFQTRDDAEACRAALADRKRSFRKGEFRFAKNNPAQRRAVLECLAGTAFRYHVVACDRSKLLRGRWRTPADLYFAMAAHLVGRLAPTLTDCTLWFDTLGGRDVDRLYGKHLQRAAGRTEANKARVKAFVPYDSMKELLIQAADYVCGAVGRSLRDPHADPDYRRIIRPREGSVEVWPDGT